jgi:hypothetical protein
VGVIDNFPTGPTSGYTIVFPSVKNILNKENLENDAVYPV